MKDVNQYPDYLSRLSRTLSFRFFRTTFPETAVNILKNLLPKLIIETYFRFYLLHTQGSSCRIIHPSVITKTCLVVAYVVLFLAACLKRRGALVVSALDFRSRGRWFDPSLCRHVVFFDKMLYSIVSLFIQVYK